LVRFLLIFLLSCCDCTISPFTECNTQPPSQSTYCARKQLFAGKLFLKTVVWRPVRHPSPPIDGLVFDHSVTSCLITCFQPAELISNHETYYFWVA
ncbi:hypothetical protein AHF37_08789, partial [Paragonimus kellicotti]